MLTARPLRFVGAFVGFAMFVCGGGAAGLIGQWLIDPNAGGRFRDGYLLAAAAGAVLALAGCGVVVASLFVTRADRE